MLVQPDTVVQDDPVDRVFAVPAQFQQGQGHDSPGGDIPRAGPFSPAVITDQAVVQAGSAQGGSQFGGHGDPGQRSDVAADGPGGLGDPDQEKEGEDSFHGRGNFCTDIRCKVRNDLQTANG